MNYTRNGKEVVKEINKVIPDDNIIFVITDEDDKPRGIITGRYTRNDKLNVAVNFGDSLMRVVAMTSICLPTSINEALTYIFKENLLSLKCIGITMPENDTNNWEYWFNRAGYKVIKLNYCVYL